MADGDTTTQQQTTQSSSDSGTQQTSQDSAAPGGGSSQTQASSQQQSQIPTRPEWVPEAHWDGEKGAFKDTFSQHYNDLVAFKAAEDSRRLTLPPNPEGYKQELSKDFKVPEGMEFKLDEADPALKAFSTWAHKAGLTQDQYSEALGVYASQQLGLQQNIATAKAAEVQKLGATGAERKTAVDTWLKAQLGEELGKHMSEFTFTAKQVEAFEKIMQRFTSQGAANFSSAHRDVSANGRVSEAEYAAMTPAQRWDYARGFDQKQFQSSGAGR